jgi:hypothetical protein
MSACDKKPPQMSIGISRRVIIQGEFRNIRRGKALTTKDTKVHKGFIGKRRLSVHILTLRDAQDVDDFGVVSDIANDPVVADPISPKPGLTTRQRFTQTSRFSLIENAFLKVLHNALLDGSVKAF